MASALANRITYQKQSTEQSPRTCGAACLSMVYRSLGLDVSQEEIWPEISKLNRFGSLASTTHLMVHDAAKRGLRAVAIEVRHPLPALRQCRAYRLNVIVNHRLQNTAAAGHYSVLADIDTESVVLHDPHAGPLRRLSQLEFLELWVPATAPSEITGHVLIAITAGGTPTSSAVGCPFCRTLMPAEIECPQCRASVSLRPRAVLGCVNDSCFARMWERICCPSCDHLWDFTKPEQGAAPSEGPELEKVFAAIDKFAGIISKVPAARNHPELSKHLDFMANSKDTLKAALTNQTAQRALVSGQLNELARTFRVKNEEQKKKMEELKKPSPPLDGHALGWALLRNLGLAE